MSEPFYRPCEHPEWALGFESPALRLALRRVEVLKGGEGLRWTGLASTLTKEGFSGHDGSYIRIRGGDLAHDLDCQLSHW